MSPAPHPATPSPGEVAYDALRLAAEQGSPDGEALVRLAEAAFWAGRHDASIKTFERAFAAFVEEGKSAAAGLVALRIANGRQQRLQVSLAGGWLRRAAALLDGDPDAVEFGYLLLARATGALQTGDLEAARKGAEGVVEIARRFGDRDLLALAQQRLGGVLLGQGNVERGLALIDEATFAAVAGDLSTYATAVVYCRTISHCRDLADYRRAGEWTEAATLWCEQQSVTGFPGICRVHRADVMRLRGAWGEAEQEARRACDELQGFALGVVGEAFMEIGEIRLRMGDLDAAEEAFREAHRLGRDPQPGLALLRLARGDVAAAGAAIGNALADEAWDRLARARLLPAQVEIALAAGALDTARVAAEELEAIADTYGSPALRAEAEHAHGALLVQAGDPEHAIRPLKRALQLWCELDAPYEAARARVSLALACRAQGDAPGAVLELEAAREAFADLGAQGDVARVEAHLTAGNAPWAQAAASRTTLTFMFTDIVRSTALVEALGDAAWSNLLHWHDQTLRSLFAAHEGKEINHTGDGFFVGFDSWDAAVECAVTIQRTLASHRHDHGFAPEVRVGLHTAEADRRGQDYGGRGVHEAARVAALAEGGEILASRGSLGEVASRYRCSAPRAVELKGFSEAVEVVSIDWREESALG